ncbi:MAG: MBL fold metallo-hydrolase [Candidatus Methylacidiphilales bacterium]
MNTPKQPLILTGGLAVTNAYAFSTCDGWWLIDAPEETAAVLQERGLRVAGMILTHGHWDHIWDAAEIASEHDCPVIAHPEDRALFENPNLMASFGLPETLRPVPVSRYVQEGETIQAGEYGIEVLHLPGHCPGSIGLYLPEEGVLFGGDVLFAGGVGRWDLPGGSHAVLMRSIREKVLLLPEETVVYPGHGESTTVGDERDSNPFIQDPV